MVLPKIRGHATMPDFYSWVDKPTTIEAPETGESIWSGSIILDMDNATGYFPIQDIPVNNVVAFFTSFKDAEEA